jgi:hypothetical protein
MTRFGAVALAGSFVCFSMACTTQAERDRERAAIEAAAEAKVRAQLQSEQQEKETKAKERAQLEADAEAKAKARLQVEAKQRMEAERKALLATPSRFLEASDFSLVDDGIIHHYRRLAALSVLNHSKFAVTNMRGELEFKTAGGDTVGSVSFALTGALPAGDSKRFATAQGTLATTKIETSSNNIGAKFTSLEIVDAQ